MTVTRQTALCGHCDCDPYAQRGSVLDAEGDVVLYNACDGLTWIFRDDVCHGLTVTASDRTIALTREGETLAAVEIEVEGRNYVARWLPSERVALRWDTRYGLIAKVARRLLKPAACCRGEDQ